MNSIRFAARLLLAAALLPSVAHAANNRSAVSILGLDTNPCTVASPCRSFQKALGQTAAGGEVIALDSGGYGGFTPFQDVIVQAAPGVYAGVTVTSGSAISVSATPTSTIVLRNLVINGLGLGQSGILLGGSQAETHVENCIIQNFTSMGINAFHNVRVSDTTIRNVNTGLWVDNVIPVYATAVNLTVVDSAGGVVAVRNATVTVSNSRVLNSTSVGFSASGQQGSPAVLNVDSSAATGGTFGATCGAGSTLRLSNVFITANTVGVDDGCTAESWGNNKISGNGTNLTHPFTAILTQQ